MEPPDHPPHLGFGLVARPDPDPAELGPIGARLEALGYAELWANDGRGRSGLGTLRAAAGTSRRLDLCLGVAPLSEKSPEELATEVERCGLPPERLVLGVGTGSAASLAMVRDSVAALRQLLPAVRLAVAALGPRMCRLAGEVADVVLLNWAGPERISWSRDRIREGALAADRPMPRVACYVRVALGPDAAQRVAAEADRYRRRPRTYARLFDEQGGEARPGAVAATLPEQVPELLAPYRAALDSCVVRALPVTRTTDELLAIAAAAAMLRA